MPLASFSLELEVALRLEATAAATPPPLQS